MKNVAILGILAVVIAGFSYYTLFSSPAYKTASKADMTQEELGSNSSEVVKKNEPKKGKGSLESLRLLNEDLECTINYSPEDNQAGSVEGTYFVSEGKMRGDFLTDSPDLSGQVLSSMIINGSDMYVWSEIEGESYGIKMNLSEVAGADSNTNQPIDLNEDVFYDCKAWVGVDYTVFEPPSKVLFKNLSELMKSGMEYGTIYNAEAELPY